MVSDRMAELGARFTEALRSGEVPEDLLTDDFVMENVDSPIVQGTYRGPDGIRAWTEDFIAAFEPQTIHYDAIPLREGPNVVIAKIELTGRGRQSGAPLDMSHWGALWIRDGKIARAVGYATLEETLKATGLAKTS